MSKEYDLYMQCMAAAHGVPFNEVAGTAAVALASMLDDYLDEDQHEKLFVAMTASFEKQKARIPGWVDKKQDLILVVNTDLCERLDSIFNRTCTATEGINALSLLSCSVMLSLHAAYDCFIAAVKHYLKVIDKVDRCPDTQRVPSTEQNVDLGAAIKRVNAPTVKGVN